MSLRLRRLQVSVLRFSVVSVALGSDGNTLFPKIHRADSNGGPQAQDGGDGSQRRCAYSGSVAIAPSSDQGMSRFFRAPRTFNLSGVRVAPALLRVGSRLLLAECRLGGGQRFGTIIYFQRL